MKNTRQDPNSKADQYRFGTAEHRAFLIEDARRQFDFFQASVRPEGGFHTLDYKGLPLTDTVQELHTTTRLIHSYALGKIAGHKGCEAVIGTGMDYLWSHHRDRDHGGYLWALDGNEIHDDRKLAYGHAFVLLAGASAKMADHPDADRLIVDVTTILETRFWEDNHGLFSDEWNRDWSPFSTYRGLNANMHSVEALLTAYETTGRERYLAMAGRILDFLVYRIGASEGWRLPEHYTQDWKIDRTYSGNPMFRPAGTTPGHSFELARLLLQHWDLSGRSNADVIETAWLLTKRALSDAWVPETGGFVYTLGFEGVPAVTSRYWWPVTEAIGVLASFLKLEPTEELHQWYSRLWKFADTHFIDHQHGGWFPEIDARGDPTAIQFNGKPDIYHSVQAALFPLATGVSKPGVELKDVLASLN
ncbi:AGE family epimerase/isomerase [Parasedimentitalea maritima]|uniref:AGE family epimerase/isomerase n=1 Tax=Parasedimentitalea maritima TaxID=2578117 RepID=A0A6A4RNP6_9RHOB|nr:AGE family epimerase/isomerase [Zongyanglinia marina]KAE9631769.1 AGE family epimerase/isomerase [Zongyanglinia marina]